MPKWIIPGPGSTAVWFLVLHSMRSLCHGLSHGLYHTLPTMMVKLWAKIFLPQVSFGCFHSEIKGTSVEIWPEKVHSLFITKSDHEVFKPLELFYKVNLQVWRCGLEKPQNVLSFFQWFWYNWMSRMQLEIQVAKTVPWVFRWVEAILKGGPELICYLLANYSVRVWRFWMRLTQNGQLSLSEEN